MRSLARLSGAWLAAALAVALCAGPAFAIESTVLPTDVDTSAKDDKGWVGSLNVGLGTAFGHNSKVVGQLDGSTFTFVLGLTGKLEYITSSHEWRNSLEIAETFSRTPAIDRFIKTADKLRLVSIYLYHLEAVPWFGPFARFSLNTSIFTGFNNQAADVIFRRSDGDFGPTDRIKLTDPFKPLTLKQSAGVFAQPWNDKAFKLEFRLGLGAREVFADDQWTTADDETTPEIEIAALADSTQIGAEAAAEATGVAADDKLTYGVGMEVLFPFFSDPDTGASMADLINFEFGATAKYAVTTWLSVDYELRIIREPLVVDEYQIANALLVTLSYSKLWE